MQIANTLDEVTLGKIKRSALIAAGGFLVAVLPMLIPQILDALTGHPVAAAFVGSAGPWIVNSIREYLKGVQP